MPRKLFALLFLCGALAHAQSIAVADPSFENATLTLSGPNGTFCNLIPDSSIPAYPLSGTLANWTAASTTRNAGAGAAANTPGGNNWPTKWWDGNYLAWLQINSAGTVSLSQTLSAVLQNNTTYTLSALVGNRLGANRFNYALQLWAGPALLASASNLPLAPGTFGTDSASYSSGSDNPQEGQPLMIVLSSTGLNGVETEAHFDAIALSASGGAAATAILPQLAFGGGWYTALYFTNLTASPASFTVNFIGGDGTPLDIPALNGSSAQVNLAARGTTIIEVPNTGSLLEGYVAAALPAGVTGYGVFRFTAQGPGQEAVVPLSGATATTSTLIFDETSYTTGVAVVALSSSAVTVNVTAYGTGGNTIGTGSIQLAANGKTALLLKDIPGLSGIVGQRGSVDFSVSGGNVAALGIRYNGQAFTSIPTSDR
jgi:hypothetical protein